MTGIYFASKHGSCIVNWVFHCVVCVGSLFVWSSLPPPHCQWDVQPHTVGTHPVKTQSIPFHLMQPTCNNFHCKPVYFTINTLTNLQLKCGKKKKKKHPNWVNKSQLFQFWLCPAQTILRQEDQPYADLLRLPSCPREKEASFPVPSVHTRRRIVTRNPFTCQRERALRFLWWQQISDGKLLLGKQSGRRGAVWCGERGEEAEAQLRVTDCRNGLWLTGWLNAGLHRGSRGNGWVHDWPDMVCCYF